MRLRTQLLIAAVTAGVVTGLVLGSMAFVAQRGALGLRAENASQEIARTVANLLTLTQEYTLYGSERASAQWRARHAQLRETVEQSLNQESPPHPALVEMQQRVLELLPLFDRLEEASRQRGTELAERRRELMVERLVSETQELVDARHRWATAIITRQARDQQLSNVIALATGAVLLLLVVGLVVLVGRRGLRPLARLQAAAGAIQRGDLSVRCEVGGNDEIGDTARAVNAMAESLLATNAALRESQERYRLAVDGANQGLWDWNLATDQLYLSARAQLLLGMQPREPTQARRAWNESQQCHPDEVGAVRRSLSEFLRSREPHLEIEYRLRHASGRWHWYRYRAVAVRDTQGRPLRLAGSMDDITSRKEAEAERERLGQQLRQAQKLEAIGTLAGGIAHDFNNILSAILGYGEMARDEAAEGTRLRRNVDAALAAGLRAKSLVERILAFSRAGLGERVAVPVAAVVGEALDSLAAALPPGVRLVRQFETAAPDMGVLGDSTQLHQVVMNLCANAIHAMKEHGTLTVALAEVQLEEALAVATSTLAPGRYVRLGVADTGTGIEPPVLERMFDPFFTTKQVGVGTGLGLSLVHGIVSDLGGGIAVESRPGEGATFSVFLPWHPFEGEAVADAEPIVGGAGQTVLIVDDEDPLVRLGEETLAALGYEPVGFVSPARALSAFRADPGRFDAVITDEVMPGISGTELCAELRRLQPGLPVVLMSGSVNASLVARAEAAGAAKVLSKPMSRDDIARSLAALFGHGPAACAAAGAAAAGRAPPSR